MAIEVYLISGSPFAWRVLLTLEVKGLAYDARVLEASKREHKEPWYLEINPRGKVPTLRDGDTVLGESLAIMAYLDRKYTDPPLFGRDADETGRVWQWVMEFRSHFEPSLDRCIGPILFGEIEEKSDAVLEAIATVHGELARIERSIAEHGWLVGDALSAADLTAYPNIAFLLRVTGREELRHFELGLHPFSERYPLLEGWCERMRALPGFDRTYPPHWRETG